MLQRESRPPGAHRVVESKVRLQFVGKSRVGYRHSMTGPPKEGQEGSVGG